MTGKKGQDAPHTVTTDPTKGTEPYPRVRATNDNSERKGTNEATTIIAWLISHGVRMPTL